MKRLYSRHFEISTDNKNWEIAKFFKNEMCYIEELPELQIVWEANTYEKVIRMLNDWNLKYMEIKIPFINKHIISIATPFSNCILLTKKNMNLYIRVKYHDESQAPMDKLMKFLSNEDFKEWAKDNNLIYFEKKLDTSESM